MAMTAFAVTLLLVSAGLSENAKTILAKPDRVVVYSVVPEGLNDFRQKNPFGFAGAITQHPLRGYAAREAVKALKRTLGSGSGAAFSCFEPHHGVQVWRNGRWVKFWICYQCKQTVVLESNGHQRHLSSGLKGKASLDRFVLPGTARFIAPRSARQSGF